MQFFDETDQAVVSVAIADLAYLCSKINSKHFACFFQYYGHTQQAGVTFFKDGWEENITGEQLSLYCTPEWETPASIVKRLEDFTEILKARRKESDLRWSTANRRATLIAKEEAKLEAAKLALKNLKLNGEDIS